MAEQTKHTHRSAEGKKRERERGVQYLVSIFGPEVTPSFSPSFSLFFFGPGRAGWTGVGFA